MYCNIETIYIATLKNIYYNIKKICCSSKKNIYCKQ
jgi:hypothetical protein